MLADRVVARNVRRDAHAAQVGGEAAHIVGLVGRKRQTALARRKVARAERDFATSDAIRDELAAKGVEVMDGDPLGWEWSLGD